MFFKKIKEALFGRTHDQNLLNELEEILIQSDVGPQLAEELMAHVRQSSDDPIASLKKSVIEILSKREKKFVLKNRGLNIVLVCGVNGSGKTTFIAKLCHFLKGHKVGVVAGDTFRAAATEQLQIWADRLKVTLFKGTAGEDPSSVIYKAIDAACDLDVLIIDTAGRLHNKEHLMLELQKVIRIIRKFDATAPHEAFLVLDATIGSNTMNQISSFQEVVPITGLVMNKLDGTAKGGVLLKVANTFDYPIYFMGVGEAKEDLKPFEAEYFVDNLL